MVSTLPRTTTTIYARSEPYLATIKDSHIIVHGDTDILMDDPELCNSGQYILITRIDHYGAPTYYSYIHNGKNWLLI